MGAASATNFVFDPIPHNAGSKFGELFAGVTPGQQVECVVQHVVADVGEVCASPHELGEFGNRPVVHGAHGHDLLGQHIEWVAQVPGRLDQTMLHAVRDDCGLDKVGTMFGEDLAPADIAHVVAGAANPLQATTDGTGRLNLHHQIDRTHIDAKLQRAGGDQPLQFAPLELILDDQPLLPTDRPMMRPHKWELCVIIGAPCQRKGGACVARGIRIARRRRRRRPVGVFGAPCQRKGGACVARGIRIARRRRRRRPVGVFGAPCQRKGGACVARQRGLFVGEFVESVGQAFGHAAGVDEDEGRPVRLDELKERRMDRWPDALAHGTGGCRAALGAFDEGA